MTRRHLARLLLTGVAVAPACSITNRDILSRLISTCEAGDLAIIGTRLGLDPENDLVPSAITIAGADAGQLQLAGSSRPPHLLALAPDGAWVAWVPEDSLPDPYGKGGEPEVCFTDNPRSARTLRYKGWFGRRLALSSRAEHIAIIARDRDAARFFDRLLVLKPATGETASDLTPLIARLDLGSAECLRLSANGARLAVGSHNLFSVVDVPAHTVLLEGEGRFPCLSPSGEELAFVDAHRKLALVSLATGASRAPLDEATTYGVGSWTPDGSLLLALVRRPLALDASLVAIDCTTGRYADITPLEEWNLGQNSGLIKRLLLSPPPRPRAA